MEETIYMVDDDEDEAEMVKVKFGVFLFLLEKGLG